VTVRRFWRGWFGLTLTLLTSSVSAQRPFDEAVMPLREYRSAETRVLAEAHAAELRRLYEDVRRCTPELDFNQPGLGFRKPRGKPQLAPHLSIWLMLDESTIPSGGNLGARAVEAFRRYGSRLFQRLLARERVRADGRVGGYGLVLTWVRPPQGDERIGETLVVFVDKTSAVEFSGGALDARALLGRADIRLFDGDVERIGVQIPGDAPTEIDVTDATCP
jgi:hypothetical protein